MRRWVTTCIGWALLPGLALAQQGAAQLELFEPAPGAGAILDLSAPDTLPPLVSTVDLWLSYAVEPLVLEPSLDTDARTEGAVVADRFRLELVGAFGVIEGLEVGAALPFGTTLGESRYDFAGRTEDDFSAFVLEDARLQVKLAPLELAGLGQPFGLGAAVSVEAWLPTGDEAALAGEGALRVQPNLLLGWRLPLVRLAAQVGYHVRPESRVFTVGVDDEVRVGAGVEVDLPLGFAVSAVGHGAHRLAASSDAEDATAEQTEDTDPVEILLAAHWRGAGPRVTVGVGRGMTAAVGVPAWRGMFRFGWDFGAAPTRDDIDHDGISDADDVCPYEPEDHDGVRDEDGCPEVAGAGVVLPVVGATAAPSGSAAPVAPGPQTAPPTGPAVPPTGAPLTPTPSPTLPPLPALVSQVDTDGDGIIDVDDRCPTEPEDDDDFEPGDGCPEPDDDNDGVLDADDKCPREAEVHNGKDDADGCPDQGEDADGDGIEDVFDRCPMEPEDFDGYHDTDGCPERGGGRPG